MTGIAEFRVVSSRQVHHLPGDWPAFPDGRAAWWAEVSALPAGIVRRGGGTALATIVQLGRRDWRTPTWLDLLLPPLDLPQPSRAARVPLTNVSPGAK